MSLPGTIRSTTMKCIKTGSRFLDSLRSLEMTKRAPLEMTDRACHFDQAKRAANCHFDQAKRAEKSLNKKNEDG